MGWGRRDSSFNDPRVVFSLANMISVAKRAHAESGGSELRTNSASLLGARGKSWGGPPVHPWSLPSI